MSDLEQYYATVYGEALRKIDELEALVAELRELLRCAEANAVDR